MREVTGYREHPGPLSSYLRKPELSVPDVLATARRVVLLEDVANPTNMGVVFRCAAGLGMDAVIITPNCADPLYRRSVRASMGESFAIPWARLDAWPSGLASRTVAGFHRCCVLRRRQMPCPSRSLRPHAPDRLALLFGAEGPGLSGLRR